MSSHECARCKSQHFDRRQARICRSVYGEGMDADTIINRIIVKSLQDGQELDSYPAIYFGISQCSQQPGLI